jgi:hypothetical protein
VLRHAAFTEDPGGGDPAGVVLDAGGLDAPAMLATAAQAGHAETALSPQTTSTDVAYRSGYGSLTESPPLSVFQRLLPHEGHGGRCFVDSTSRA